MSRLDDKPIATSKRILCQMGTIARPTGWKEKAMRIPTKEGTLDGSRIVDAGRPPWQVEKMRGALGVRNPSITRATVLDPNGMPISDIPIWRGRRRDPNLSALKCPLRLLALDAIRKRLQPWTTGVLTESSLLQKVRCPTMRQRRAAWLALLTRGNVPSIRPTVFFVPYCYLIERRGIATRA